MFELEYVLIFAGSVLIASVAQLLLKFAAMKKYSSFWREYLNWRVILSYGLLFGSLILTSWAYTGVPLKVGAVVESLGYVYILILSTIFVHERITLRKIIGNLFIIAGVVVSAAF
jgi:drug/metabolite transporter (DMT)-like permease